MCFALRGSNEDVRAIARKLNADLIVEGSVRQIGGALHMYIQDYDEHLPICCSFARVWTLSDLTGRCRQDGITSATPIDTYLGPVQNPPRFIQELLHPYVRNAAIWFCPPTTCYLP